MEKIKEILITSKVTVIDAGNYKDPEQVPFAGLLRQVIKNEYFYVQSIATGREYELYSFQIKEVNEIVNGQDAQP